jgi:beta-lactamase class D
MKMFTFFATNIDIRNDNEPTARAEVTRRCLETLQLLSVFNQGTH